jgi:putative aminopeptidase FrvX
MLSAVSDVLSRLEKLCRLAAPTSAETEIADALERDWSVRRKRLVGTGSAISQPASAAPGLACSFKRTWTRSAMRCDMSRTDGLPIYEAGIPTALLAIPTRCTHTAFEMVDPKDVEACTDLLSAFLATDQSL